VTIRPGELLESVNHLIREHAQRHGIADADAEAYFNEVQGNALQAAAVGHQGPAAINEFLHNCQLIAVRMYTTAAALAGGKELCGILNEAVRAALTPPGCGDLIAASPTSPFGVA
jgi:hypothetical protein